MCVELGTLYVQRWEFLKDGENRQEMYRIYTFTNVLYRLLNLTELKGI